MPVYKSKQRGNTKNTSQRNTIKKAPLSNKEDVVVVEGKVTRRLPNAHFEVALENGHLLKGVYISGSMRSHFINVAVGDTVKVAMTRYDTSKGRIIFRGAGERRQS